MLLLQRASRVRSIASNQSRVNTLIVVSAVFVALFAQLQMYGLRIPAEAALSLQCGMLIVDGKIPFIDFMEVAAPSSMYFSAIPALVCKILPTTHPVVIFHNFVFALAVGSCALTALILFKQKTREQAHVPAFIIACALLNLVMVKEFGQREHLFLLGYIPFLVSRWLSWTNQATAKKLSIIAGIAGGVAIILDPIFLVIAVLMELYFCVSKQKFVPLMAPEMRAAMVVCVIYLFHFVFSSPNYSNVYFNYALPMVICDYITFDERLWWVNKTPDNREIVYFMMLACSIALGVRRWCSLIPPCIALAVVGFGTFVITGKSMTAQMFPMFCGSFLTFALVVSIASNAVLNVRALGARLLKPVIVAVIVGICAVSFTYMSTTNHDDLKDVSDLGYSGTYLWTEESAFATRLQVETKPGDKVLILNDRVRPAYPLLVQFNRRPASYLLTGYPIRMSRLLMERDAANAAKYTGPQFRMYERLIEDIKTVKPKFMMIEKESLGEVLKEHKVFEVIDNLYQEFAYAEWPDRDEQPSFDYYAFRTPLVCYKLKTPTPDAASAPSATTAPLPTNAPSAPQPPDAAPAPSASPAPDPSPAP